MTSTPPADETTAETSDRIVPLLSVIIPCHNGAATLGLQLRALAQQASPPPFEVLIVDNRSADHPDRVVDSIREALLASGATEVRAVPASAEAGASYARNVGAAHAQADRLVFCDADDCVSEHWLRDAAQLFEQAPAFSGSALPLVDTEFGSDVPALQRWIDADRPEKPMLVAQQPLAIPILMGGDFGITKALYVELGGFDQSLPAAGEDNDLAVRIRQAGHGAWETHSLRIAYRKRPTSDDEHRRNRHAARTHVLLCVRYGALRRSAFVGGLRLPISTAKLLASAIRMALVPSRRDFPGLRGRAAGILGFWEGLLLFGVLRRTPAPRLGVGLAPDPPPRSAM